METGGFATKVRSVGCYRLRVRTHQRRGNQQCASTSRLSKEYEVFQVSFFSGELTSFSHVELVPDDAVVSAFLSFRRCYILTSIKFTGSQDLAVKSHSSLTNSIPALTDFDKCNNLSAVNFEMLAISPKEVVGTDHCNCRLLINPVGRVRKGQASLTRPARSVVYTVRKMAAVVISAGKSNVGQTDEQVKDRNATKRVSRFAKAALIPPERWIIEEILEQFDLVSLAPMRVKLYGAWISEVINAWKRRTPRKPADQRQSPPRFPQTALECESLGNRTRTGLVKGRSSRHATLYLFHKEYEVYGARTEDWSDASRLTSEELGKKCAISNMLVDLGTELLLPEVDSIECRRPHYDPHRGICICFMHPLHALRALDILATNYSVLRSSLRDTTHIFVNDLPNHAGRCRWSAGFLGDLPFPAPLHSGAAPCPPRFALIGSQDLDVKSRPNLFTRFTLSPPGRLRRSPN
ncbi:hypothetical protein PR048_013660 [Dryococelus australis]|uniref:Uncharacterized protein n=1 Tax=Dryococelus australis TaxID=614101 RepID=A0ABQ9HST1_9NEOP|nr:hypothetical protein PR048_013660 [Dryococelus australis]